MPTSPQRRLSTRGMQMSDAQIAESNFDAQDEMSEWAVSHADELAALDRAAREKSE